MIGFLKIDFVSSCPPSGPVRKKSQWRKRHLNQPALWIHTFRNFVLCHANILLYLLPLSVYLLKIWETNEAIWPPVASWVLFEYIFIFSKPKNSFRSTAVTIPCPFNETHGQWLGISRAWDTVPVLLAGTSGLASPHCGFLYMVLPEISGLGCREMKQYTLEPWCQFQKLQLLGSETLPRPSSLSGSFADMQAACPAWARSEKSLLLLGWLSQFQNK